MRQQEWKQIEDSEICYYLTGESILKAITIPQQPNSKKPAIVRVTHTNDYGPVDSELFVRLGDPKSPLGATDFDTVSDWQKATLVEDLLWSDDLGEWVLRAKAKGYISMWSGTYDTEIQFPQGHHLIEIKIISHIEHVCSIILSDWEVKIK